MDKRLCLEDHYAEWLTLRGIHHRQNIILNFKGILQNLHQHQFTSNNKGIYLINHAQFLMEALGSVQTQSKISFHSIILILNYILKIKTNIRIPFRISTIQAINNHVLTNKQALDSPHFTSSILWLICKGLHSHHNKRNILGELDKCQLITCILDSACLDQLGQRALTLLLYYICKNKVDGSEIAIKILERSHKFKESEAIRHILAILKDMGLLFYQTNRSASAMLAKFMVQYINNPNFTVSSKLESLDLILHAATRHPHLMDSLKIFEFIQKKISVETVDQEPLLEELTKVMQLQRNDKEKINKYLELAVLTIANNVIARRIFIMFHEQLTHQQLFKMLSHGVLSSLLIEIDSSHQIQNSLKLLICLKRSVVSLGLNPIFWYASKPLIKRIMEFESSALRAQQKDLLELFELTLKQEIQFINYI